MANAGRTIQWGAATGLLVTLFACARPEADAERTVLESVDFDDPAGDVIPFDSLPAAKVPAILENTCEGEGCEASYAATACRDVRLLSSPTNSTRAATLKRGDTVNVRTDLHIRKPGVVLLKRDHITPIVDPSDDSDHRTLRFSARDTLLLVHYMGEGYWEARYKGRRLQLPEFWAGATRTLGSSDSALARVAIAESEPTIDSWLRISREGRVIGWWLDDPSEAIAPIGAYAEKWELGCPSRAIPAGRS